MRKAGYTLLEISFSLAILTVISLFIFMAVASSARSVRTSEAEVDVQSNVRDVLRVMVEELQTAGKESDASLAPPLQGVSVVANPTDTSPVEIVFQVPADRSGTQWSTPIRYRYVNEDTNGNALLDSGEDKNANGLLDRRIFRIQDINGDGDTADDGENRPIGGVNDLSDVQFVRNGDVVQITVSSTSRFQVHDENHASATSRTQVYLLN